MSIHSRVRSRFAIVVLLILALGQPLVAQAQAEGQEESGTAQLVTGAAAFVVSPVYGAFKLAFAGGGAIVGSLTWLFTGGDRQAAQRVWDASLKGTYIISPEHLKGKRPIRFTGS